MNKLWILTMAFIGFLHLGCSDFLFLQEYKNDSLDFKLKYPGDWTLQEGVQGAVAILLSPKETGLDKFQENVNISIQELGDQRLTLAALTQLITMQVREVLGNVRIIESSSYSLAGQPAQRIVYTVDIDYQLKMVSAWTIHNGRAYILTYTGEFDRFVAFMPKVEKIFGSFQFLKSPALGK